MFKKVLFEIFPTEIFSWNFIKPFQSLCSWYRYLSYCFFSLGKNSSIHKLDLILLFILKMKTEGFYVRYLSHYTALQNTEQCSADCWSDIVVSEEKLSLLDCTVAWPWPDWCDWRPSGEAGNLPPPPFSSSSSLLQLSSPPPTSDPVTQHHCQTGEIIYNSK